MFCSRCGTSLADGSQFCVECGHTVEAVAVTPLSATDHPCEKCNKSIPAASRYCPSCGSAVPRPAAISVAESGSAAAAATAYETAYWQKRSGPPYSRILIWLLVVLGLVGAGWVAATNSSISPQVRAYLTTPHAESIADGSIAIKPRGFTSYRVAVPEGAIDVAVTGQFDASGRTDDNVQVLLLTDAEFVIWQSGYATSPFYDSGKVSQATLEAPLPSHAGTYYLILSNKTSKVEKTVHVSTALHYDTWLPDGVLYLKEKVWAWFN